MRIARNITLSLLATIAGAFAQSGATSPAPKTGTIHVYRLPLEIGKGVHPTVSCDTYPMARMQNGRVYTITVAPGTHTFTTVDGHTSVNIHVEAGQEYFVRIDYPVNSRLALKAYPVLVPPDQGSAEIKKLKPLDNWYIETTSCSTN